MHFGFNAWGEKFPPWDQDAAVGRLIAERLGDVVVESALVLEGGSILTDGEGTLLTTEQCLLNPNRNPSLSREEIEAPAALPGWACSGSCGWGWAWWRTATPTATST